MTEQGEIRFYPPEEPASIQEAFERFHRDNPHVYRKLVALARQWKDRGHRKLGIGMLWEVMRWQLHMETEITDGDFKLNNNHRSRYARLLMDREPDLADVFEVRELKS